MCGSATCAYRPQPAALAPGTLDRMAARSGRSDLPSAGAGAPGSVCRCARKSGPPPFTLAHRPADFHSLGASITVLPRQVGAAGLHSCRQARRLMVIDRPSAGQRRPNLLFVFGDEHRGEALGCAGIPGLHPAEPLHDVRTPVLDRLAAEGLRFTHAFANAPVCTPSRGSLLTGLWPAHHRALSNDLPVESGPATPSIARTLRDAGYRCGYVGKWPVRLAA